MKRVTLTVLGSVYVDLPDDTVLPEVFPVQGTAVGDLMSQKGPDGSTGVLIKGLHIHSIFAAFPGDSKEQAGQACSGLLYSFGLMKTPPATAEEKKAQHDRLKKELSL